MRNAKVKITMGGIALATALTLVTAPPAQANPGANTAVGPKAVETGQRITDYRGWTVVHWGPGWSSGPLDASVSRNRVAANFDHAASTEKASGWTCSLFVGVVIINSHHQEQAGTEQTCEGSFTEKFVTAQFNRKNLIGAWVNFGSSGESAHTSDQIDDVTWTKSCPGGSSWYYRLEAVGWARSTDGTLTSGPYTDGKQSGKFACGT